VKEKTPSPECHQESISTDTTKPDLPENIQDRIDKCDTLIDRLEENGSARFSSKETTPGSTVYPEFSNAISGGGNPLKNISLKIRICTTEISHSDSQHLTADMIITSDEPVDKTVDLIWKDQVIGSGHLRARDNYYVIEIAGLREIQQQDHAYEI
tara:strand:+ start:429 stop:893 length:465 start_codon:yes stop_codon:yes gene_type:complete